MSSSSDFLSSSIEHSKQKFDSTKSFMKKNKSDVCLWMGLALVLIGIFVLFSSGDFSFILTMSSLVQTFGFLYLLMNVYASRQMNGLSMNMLISYSVSLFFRLCAILFYHGYLPSDSSGDFVYRFSEIVAFACCASLLYLCVKSTCFNDKNTLKYVSAYDSLELDTLKWQYFVIPAISLGLMVHPSLNVSFFADSAWTIGLYLESIAMLPQLNLFRKKGGEIEEYTSHFVASQAISRIVQFVFWAFTFTELNSTKRSTSLFPDWAGYFVLIVQIVQIGLTGDFLYFYFTSIRKGIPLTLPSYI